MPIQVFDTVLQEMLDCIFNIKSIEGEVGVLCVIQQPG